MVHSPLYSVIVLCHNHLDTTKRCLEALARTDLSQARLIVVDNGSTDGTAEYLLSLKNALTMAFTDHNHGVGAGYNFGFQLVDSPFFVTLNNDMLIYDPQWLERLHAPFENPKMAQVGLEGTSCWLDWYGMGHPMDSLMRACHARADYVETSCMMGRTDAVRECGELFDPAYRFAYCEDSDLSLRLRSKGYEITHIPLRVEHIGGVTLQDKQTTGAKDYYVANHLLLQQRWGKYLRTKSFA